ncbi:MAG: hypothetical protein ACTSWZ_07770 [Candidatus Heimdallarchaeaceae archaeon]
MEKRNALAISVVIGLALFLLFFGIPGVSNPIINPLPYTYDAVVNIKVGGIPLVSYWINDVYVEFKKVGLFGAVKTYSWWCAPIITPPVDLTVELSIPEINYRETKKVQVCEGGEYLVPPFRVTFPRTGTYNYRILIYQTQTGVKEWDKTYSITIWE